MNYHRKNIFIFFVLGVFFSSCTPTMKWVFNIKNPKVYSSYTEAKPILQSQIKKTGITDYSILYPCKTWNYTYPLYFDSAGNPIPRNSCGMPVLCKPCDTTEILSTKVSLLDTVSFNYVIQNLVIKDSLPFTKSLHEYDYIVLMPKTTYMAGVEKRQLKDIQLTIPSGSKIYYLFVSTDFYLWQNNEVKAGQKGKIRFRKCDDKQTEMVIEFKERKNEIEK
jgi:hypothetical protein